MPKVSVIVPVYNGETYLRNCIDSLLRQTLQDIEILTVNNGSSDGSGAILAEYAQADQRIKVLTLNPNRGPSGARNAALDAAVGEYVAFCDCDDEVPEDAYEMFYKTAVETGADVIAADYVEDMDGEVVHHKICRPGKNVYVICEMGALWNKLYSRKFLEAHQLRIPNYIGDEDLLFLGLVVEKTPKFSMLGHVVYKYCRREANQVSQTKLFTLDVIRDDVQARKRYDKIVSSMGYEAADSRAFYSFRYVFRKWCNVIDRHERKEAFFVIQEFVNQNDWRRTAGRFKALVGMRPDEFACADYEEFLCQYHSYAIQILAGLEEKEENASAKNRTPPEIQTADLFKNGKLGFQYIWNYIRKWFAFKVRRLMGEKR